MRRNFIAIRRSILVLLMSLPLCATADTAADQESHWLRAVALHQENKRWIPGTMYLRSEELTKDGDIKSTEVREFRTYFDEELRQRTELVYFEKDGQDITEEEKDKRETESDEGDSDGGLFPSPFDPALQDQITARRTDKFESVNGHRCRVYEFEMSIEQKRKYVGEVWISEMTAIPIKIVATMRPLPLFVNFMTMIVLYSDAPDTWYITDVYFEGAGSFLFVKRHFRSTMKFTNYVEKPVPPT